MLALGSGGWGGLGVGVETLQQLQFSPQWNRRGNLQLARSVGFDPDHPPLLRLLKTGQGSRVESPVRLQIDAQILQNKGDDSLVTQSNREENISWWGFMRRV